MSALLPFTNLSLIHLYLLVSKNRSNSQECSQHELINGAIHYSLQFLVLNCNLLSSLLPTPPASPTDLPALMGSERASDAHRKVLSFLLASWAVCYSMHCGKVLYCTFSAVTGSRRHVPLPAGPSKVGV